MPDGFALDSKLKWFSSVGLFLGKDFPTLITVFTAIRWPPGVMYQQAPAVK